MHDAGSVPLVFLQSHPQAATLTLLCNLRQGGTSLHHHGDFDWGGLRLASTLLRRVPCLPWCHTAADYPAAAHTRLRTRPHRVILEPIARRVPELPLREVRMRGAVRVEGDSFRS
ncbi:DUF2399 domain-containing protein [Streptomyces sp. NBC_01294]|nr:DUF2399 domain-containing protein [Streptomyces sp. NBC_01294]